MMAPLPLAITVTNVDPVPGPLWPCNERALPRSNDTAFVWDELTSPCVMHMLDNCRAPSPSFESIDVVDRHCVTVIDVPPTRNRVDVDAVCSPVPITVTDMLPVAPTFARTTPLTTIASKDKSEAPVVTCDATVSWQVVSVTCRLTCFAKMLVSDIHFDAPVLVLPSDKPPLLTEANPRPSTVTLCAPVAAAFVGEGLPAVLSSYDDTGPLVAVKDPKLTTEASDNPMPLGNLVVTCVSEAQPPPSAAD